MIAFVGLDQRAEDPTPPRTTTSSITTPSTPTQKEEDSALDRPVDTIVDTTIEPVRCVPSKLGALRSVTIAWCVSNCWNGAGELAPACNPAMHSDHRFCNCDEAEQVETPETKSITKATQSMRQSGRTVQPRYPEDSNPAQTSRGTVGTAVVVSTASRNGSSRSGDSNIHSGAGNEGNGGGWDDAMKVWLWVAIAIVTMVCAVVIVVRRKLKTTDDDQVVNAKAQTGKPDDIQINGTWDRTHLEVAVLQREGGNNNNEEVWGNLGTALAASERWSTPPGSPSYQEPMVFGLREYAEIDASPENITNSEHDCRRYSQHSASPDYEPPMIHPGQLVGAQTILPQYELPTAAASASRHRGSASEPLRELEDSEGYAPVLATQRYIAPALPGSTEYADCDDEQQRLYEYMYGTTFEAVGATEHESATMASRLQQLGVKGMVDGKESQSSDGYHIIDDAMIQVNLRRRSTPFYPLFANPGSFAGEEDIQYMRDADRQLRRPGDGQTLYYFDRGTGINATNSVVPPPTFVGDGPQQRVASNTGAQLSALPTVGPDKTAAEASPQGDEILKTRARNLTQTVLEYDRLVSGRLALRSPARDSLTGVDRTDAVTSVGTYDSFRVDRTRPTEPNSPRYESVADRLQYRRLEDRLYDVADECRE